MTRYLAAGFNTLVLGGANLSLEETSEPTANVNFGSGAARQCMVDLSSLATTIGSTYVAMPAQLTARFTAASPAGQSYSVTWDPVTKRVTVATSGATPFHLVFSGATGTLGREILGFSASTPSLGPAALSWTGDIRPKFIIVPSLDGYAAVSEPYELGTPASGAVSDSGRDYTRTRSDTAIGDDWQIQFEPKAAVFARLGGASWTWEDFVRHVRGDEPFAAVDDVDQSVHRLRPEGAVFDETFRSRRVADFDDWWDISLRTYLLGYL